MAESRVEKFKEYRKSIISDGSPVLKSQIDTTLNTVTEESNVDHSEQFKLLKGLKFKRRFVVVLFVLFVLAVAGLLTYYGIKFF